MKFILNMARREMRSSWHRLLLFFLCIAVGVGSIISLRSLAQKMKAAVGREARVMYAADVQVGVNRAWKPETKEVLERYNNSPLIAVQTEIIETQTMLLQLNSPDARPVMVILRGVQDQFPLYGEMQLAGGAPYRHSMLKGRGILVPTSLVDQINLKIGDEVKLGQTTFTVRGVLEKMPGYGINLRPVPRVVVDYAEATSAGLTGFGSWYSFVRLYKTQEGKDQAFLDELNRELRRARPSWLGSFRGLQNFANTILERLEGHLGFAGLVILILGGVGISSVTRVFVQQKMKTIAILKCLGSNNRRVLGAYLLQALALCVIGSLLGLIFAGVMTVIIPRSFEGSLPFQFEPGLTWRATFEGLGIGVLVTLLFALPPLLEIRRIKPLLVMRQDVSGERRRIDWLSLSATMLIALVLFGVTSWQEGSFKIAGITLGTLAATALVLSLIGTLLIKSLRQMRRFSSFTLRQGIGSLYRPGNQTKVILLAVGLGTLFVTAMRLQQSNLMREMNVEMSLAASDLYLLDIQKDQRANVESAVVRLAGAAAQFIPVVPMRSVEIKRAPDNQQTLRRGMLGREHWATYRLDPVADEAIVEGKFWAPTPSAEPEVSVREGFARDYKLLIGEVIVFDILGQRIEAKVTSFRRPERRFTVASGYNRFDIIFRPGTLEAAPQTFIGAVKGPPPGDQRAKIQREFIEQFPNVTLIDVYDQVAFVRTKINDVSLAVTFIGGFVFLCGVLILIGSVAMTKFHRLYEAAILKTLGAEKRLIICITLVEYGVLGLLAGITGSGAAVALTWLISKYGMNVVWHPAPSINLIGVGITFLLVMAVGVLSSWDVMMKKPLGILRAE
jgi:putative ABC transport system permease protein